MKKYVFISIGSFINAMAISLLLDPNSLAPGGVTGLAIILNRLTDIGTGTFIFLINIPILLVGMWKFGWKFIVSSFYSIVLISAFTNFLQPVGAVTQDKLLAALVGGALLALSLGMIFKVGATTGGTDIIVKLLRLKFPHLKTGTLFFLTDAVIVTISGFVFQDIEVALYAGIVVVVNSLLMDIVLYGRDGAKMIFIISDKQSRISARLLEELGVGVTYLNAEGAYSGKEKRVILCIVKKHLYPKAENIVRQEDAQVFMIVTNATEIYGQGYKSILSEKI